MDATNNVAERVMRILVMIRKNWGGNRTEQGARAQAVLASILCTAKQQDKDVFALLVDLLRSAEPKLLDLLPTNQPGSQACSGDTPEIRKSSDPPAPIPFLPSVDGFVSQQTAAPPIFNSVTGRGPRSRASISPWRGPLTQPPVRSTCSRRRLRGCCSI